MIKEAYCSYEVSKLLKEKGFPQDYDIYHSMIYNEKDYEDEYEVQRMVTETQFIKAGTLSSYPVGVPEPKCYAPTHQMAMRWLREKNIGITPEIHTTQNPNDYFWSAIIYYLDKSWDIIGHISVPSKNISEGYDDVIEQAIKYVLENLI